MVMENINTTRTIYLSVTILIALMILPLFFPTGLNSWNHIRSGLLQKFTYKKSHEVSEVIAIYVYPIKSCRGFRVSKAYVQSKGLDLDRSWMIVDSKTNKFLTIRQIPKMTLIDTGLSKDGKFLELRVPKAATTDDKGEHRNKKVIRILAHPNADWLATHTRLSRVTVWDDTTDGYLYGPDVNESLSEFLNQNVALVYKGPTRRILTGNGDPRLSGREQDTHFADVYPILIASESSMGELNSRLTTKGTNPITIERFRPNIIVKGNSPWSEDSWKLVQFNNRAFSPGRSQALREMAKPVVMDVLTRRTRCEVPNVDPDTAKKHETEPWNTLMSYRRVDEGMKFRPCFGMACAPQSEGEIEVGMKFQVLSVTNEHRYVSVVT